MNIWSCSAPPKEVHPKKFRILALDGGGVRAILQAKLIMRLQEVFPEFINSVDMFAGASAGSIVALALACGLSPAETVAFWEKSVGSIFNESYLKRLAQLDNAIGSSYPNADLKVKLTDTFGEKTLAQLSKKVLIPSFCLSPSLLTGESRWSPVFLNNFSGSSTADTTIVDACMRSSAAPTYFPIYQGFVDGGTFANNPSLCAVTTALNSGMKLDEVEVLSISTGNNPQCISKKQYGNGNWGLLEWGPHIIDLLLESGTQAIDYSCKGMLRHCYCRLDPLLPRSIGLDQATAVPTLESIADKVDLAPTIAWLREHWHLKPAEFLPLTSLVPPLNPSDPGYQGWKCLLQ